MRKKMVESRLHWSLGSLPRLCPLVRSDLQPLSYVALCHLPEQRSGFYEWSPLSQASPISSLTHTVSVFILALALHSPHLAFLPGHADIWTFCLPCTRCVCYACCPRFTALDFLMHHQFEISIWTHICGAQCKWIWSPCSKSCSVSRQWWRVSSLDMSESFVQQNIHKASPTAVTLKITPCPHLPDLWPNLMGRKIKGINL